MVGTEIIVVSFNEFNVIQSLKAFGGRRVYKTEKELCLFSLIFVEIDRSWFGKKNLIV